jgi:hypothetical protein
MKTKQELEALQVSALRQIAKDENLGSGVWRAGASKDALITAILEGEVKTSPAESLGLLIQEVAKQGFQSELDALKIQLAALKAQLASVRLSFEQFDAVKELSPELNKTKELLACLEQRVKTLEDKPPLMDDNQLHLLIDQKVNDAIVLAFGNIGDVINDMIKQQIEKAKS